jgi:hypothetical protein
MIRFSDKYAIKWVFDKKILGLYLLRPDFTGRRLAVFLARP